MKKKILLLFLLTLPMVGLLSQEKDTKVPLIGSTAPAFTAESTNGKLNFPADYSTQWKILFSHPKDFTPVCSSELLELAQKQDEFEKLGVKLVVLSTDILDQHYTWKKTLDTLRYKNRAPEVINFPLVDDHDMKVSKLYGMIHKGANTTRDVRGVFIVDPSDKIRAIFFYPMEVGRNLDEIERTILALQITDNQKVLTPANWNSGEDVFIPYMPANPSTELTIYHIAPFMTAKKIQ